VIADNGGAFSPFVAVLDGATDSISAIYSAPGEIEGALGVAVNPVTNRVYVATISVSNGARVGSVAVIDGGAPPVLPPACRISQIVAGPPRQLVVAMQAADTGLQSIEPFTTYNVSVTIPVFSPGTTDPVLVTATKLDQSQLYEVAFTVTDMASLQTSCDPVDFTVSLAGAT
jgi:hypothetical protein